MLDRKFIVENVDAVKANIAHRGMHADVDRFVQLEQQLRVLQTEVQELNRRANEVSKTIGQAKDAEEREQRKEQGKALRAQKDDAQARLDVVETELDELHRAIPNMAHPDAPHGMDDKSNLEVKRGATPIPKFDFTPLDHVDLAQNLDLMDLEGGSKVAGHGFYFLKNEAVLLELALQRYVVGVLIDKGFTPTITPDLARNEILSGVGFQPRGSETQIYSVENTDLSLVATAEITLGGLYSDQILDVEDLPIRICGISHCFRTEAGAYGRATRGIFRVHQFTKVEMFAFTTPEQSDEMHDALCAIECEIFDSLGIPYRVVDTSTGDLGAPAYRKFDLEAWMPGRGDGGEFGEITSTSNCTDYQARRLGTRYRIKGEKGTQFVHTLNGTAVAISRALVAILENYQQADGSIAIPKVLQPLVGFDQIKPRKSPS